MKPERLAEEIAKLINHGLSNKEITAALESKKAFGPRLISQEDIIAVIRYLMTKPNAPEACPTCGSVDMNYENIEIDGNEASQKVTCNNGHCWYEIYTFNRIQKD